MKKNFFKLLSLFLILSVFSLDVLAQRPKVGKRGKSGIKSATRDRTADGEEAERSERAR